jgi:hypothetical protein
LNDQEADVNMTWTLQQVLLVGALATVSLKAGTIPYPTPGTQNPTTYTFVAASTGPIVAYFYGTGAAYTETLGMDINGVPTGITGLNNHSTSVGTSLDLGTATAGDTLTFFIDVFNTGNVWYSNQSLNSDGANHVYSTSFAGNATIPAGTYVGFEDLAASVSDFNYADEQFVFTNTTGTVSGAVPEPASVWLVGLLLAGFVVWQLRANRLRA